MGQPLSFRRPKAAIRTVWDGVRTLLHGHDLWILTAGVTFYSLLAAVPSLLVAIRVTAAVAGRDRVDSLAAAMGKALPAAQSPAPLIETVAHHGAALSWPAVLVALVPATIWGEGLRRGFGRIVPASAGTDHNRPPGRWEGWRSRLAALPILLLSPIGLLAVLGVAPELSRLLGAPGADGAAFGAAGPGRTALAFYIALNVDWVVVSVVLVYTYGVLGPVWPGWRSLLAASFFTGAFISGFLQGFVIFLAIPVNLGSPFGGFATPGAVVAVALWMWLFMALLVVGYAITLSLAERLEPEGVDTRAAVPRPRPRSFSLLRLRLRRRSS
jgi:membrane protein